MAEIAAGEFKARCLRLLDQVADEGIELIVTKRGRPVAMVVPVDQPRSLQGSATVLVERDENWFSTADLVDLPGDLGQ